MNDFRDMANNLWELKHTVSQIWRQMHAMLKMVAFYHHCCLTSCCRSKHAKTTWEGATPQRQYQNQLKFRCTLSVLHHWLYVQDAEVTTPHCWGFQMDPYFLGRPTPLRNRNKFIWTGSGTWYCLTEHRKAARDWQMYFVTRLPQTLLTVWGRLSTWDHS